jgi:hypothetical protein
VVLQEQSTLLLKNSQRMFNPKIRGWVAYYGRFGPTALRRALRPLNRRLIRRAQ